MNPARIFFGSAIAMALLASCSAPQQDKARQQPAAASASPSSGGAALADGAEAPSSEVTRADYEAAVVGTDPAAMDNLLRKLPKFSDDEGHEVYVYEGDLPYTAEEVRAVIERERARRKAEAHIPAGSELKLELYSPGKRLFWPTNDRSLTYAVDKVSFAPAPAGTYDLVVNSIEAAARQWENLCPSCGLTIHHKTQLDGKIDKSQVTFVVRYSSQPSNDIALAFFPASPEDQRTLWVLSQYATTRFDKVGVFRHELGHVLGYAHEHLDALSGCAKTGDAWTPITTYDRKSVMHYVCGDNEGSRALAFTDCDSKGHQRIYGRALDAPPPVNLPPIKCGTPL